MSAPAVASSSLKQFRSPRSVIGRFVARRTLRSTVLWAYVFGAYMASKTVGFAKAYPTPESRVKIAHTFGNNIGLNALLGTPRQIETIAGYAAWNSLSVLTMVGSIWALLLATKYFRGEEDNGRAELLQSGQTTARSAALNTLAGLGSALLLLYAVAAVIFVIVGHLHSVGFSTSGSLFFAMSSVAGAAFFLSVGALTSQLMPTRSRASSLAAVIFGVCFLIRAMADVTSLHWLLNLSPLGWIERLQPLTGSRPIWLLPIFGSTLLLCGLSVWLAGRRDLGESILAAHDSALPRTALLNTPLMAALRLNRATSLSWLAATLLMGAFYGLLTKAAVQAIAQAGSAHKAFSKIAHTSQINLSSLFLGVAFLILMVLVMSYVANAIGKVREDEAEGYVDNFLVRPVSRMQWLSGRAGLISLISLLACLSGSFGVWAGQASQHGGASFHDLLLAGLNMLAPVLFTLGAGVAVFGIRPRLTSVAVWGVLGWSFLISMVASGVNLSHWLLDTSLLHQVALAPATPPNWTTNSVMIGLGLGLALIGIAVFNQRDLQSE